MRLMRLRRSGRGMAPRSKERLLVLTDAADFTETRMTEKLLRFGGRAQGVGGPASPNAHVE